MKGLGHIIVAPGGHIERRMGQGAFGTGIIVASRVNGDHKDLRCTTSARMGRWRGLLRMVCWSTSATRIQAAGGVTRRAAQSMSRPMKR